MTALSSLYRSLGFACTSHHVETGETADRHQRVRLGADVRLSPRCGDKSEHAHQPPNYERKAC